MQSFFENRPTRLDTSLPSVRHIQELIRPRTVVIEFPDLKAAQDCYHSPEYQAAKAKRDGVSFADLCIVEGYA